MADDNDDQAEALIAALAPKIAEAIIPQLTEQVETQIAGVVKKNDELLDKLAKQKSDGLTALLQSADRDMRERLDADGKFVARKPGDAIKISREDARNVKAYREARALAEKEGVGLEIVAS
ncbi:hypothetical protein ACERZ8_17325 [Tateyamaria armeniaca]|uniref:Uncharacterized protein n=1 Tax=Tateyamaria armeniaca TaxID=2518930 RepID=A0ABW8V0Q1_9RHOB